MHSQKRYQSTIFDTKPELSLAGVLGRNVGVLLTIFQPEGADYAHHITGSTLGFGNLTTALKADKICLNKNNNNNNYLFLYVALTFYNF